MKAFIRQRKVSRLDRLMGRSFFDTIKQTSFCSVSEDTLSFPFTLKVNPQFDFINYNVRPFNGKTKRNGNAVEIEICGPTKISVEFDGDIDENLFVFKETVCQYKCLNL